MKKFLLLPAMLVLLCCQVFAEKGKKTKKIQEPVDSAQLAVDRYFHLQDSVTAAMKYQTGRISLLGSNAVLNVPTGFKFINADQAQFVISEVWGNPKRTDVLGILMPSNADPFSDSSYAYVITYDPMGYVKDDDAKDIDYDDMMKDFQASETEENKERGDAGYEPIHFVGWAQKPFYDEHKKVLHWAKNLKFGDAETNTLNYEVRVLGRNGILSMNAVASMSELPLVKKDIDKVLAMAEFNTGYAYSDFNSSTDNVAAYTIGGLVAGKVLAKVGFFAIIAKFAKVIIAAIIGAFYFIRKKLTGKERRSSEETTEPAAE